MPERACLALGEAGGWESAWRALGLWRVLLSYGLGTWDLSGELPTGVSSRPGGQGTARWRASSAVRGTLLRRVGPASAVSSCRGVVRHFNNAAHYPSSARSNFTFDGVTRARRCYAGSLQPSALRRSRNLVLLSPATTLIMPTKSPFGELISFCLLKATCAEYYFLQ